jgi:hypothetical protein
LWLFVSGHRERLGFGNLSVRGALVLVFLAFEIPLLAITDLTSIDHHFTAGTVAVAWSIIIILRSRHWCSEPDPERAFGSAWWIA